MNNYIQTLVKLYRKKHQLWKMLTLNYQQNILHKLLQNNIEILNISNEEFKKNIITGIRNSIVQQNMINIFWGTAADSSTGKTGILLLVKKEQDCIEQLSENFIEQKLNELIQHIGEELLLFKKFSKDFVPLYQEKLSLNIIGFGEISTVFEISGGSTYQTSKPARQSWVFKKMPIFSDLDQAKSFSKLYKEYRRLLHDEIGLFIPEQKVHIYPLEQTKIRVYALQKRTNPQAVCHRLIQLFNVDQCSVLLKMVLSELKKVWSFNKIKSDIKIALDGQISNWALFDFIPGHDTFTGQERLLYIDTSSPLFRLNGEEQLDAELFLKSTPFFLRPIIRAFFLQEVLDRYYDLHLVTVDLIANFYKEGRAEFIPQMIETANRFFTEQMPDFNIQPLTEEEVTKYYKSDAFIWKFYLAARKIDRFITEKIVGKKYDFRLPEHVQR